MRPIPQSTYMKSWGDDEYLSFEDWRKQLEAISPQFFYWSRTLDIELMFLDFLMAQRGANYPLYIESLTKLLPFLFATDHFH